MELLTTTWSNKSSHGWQPVVYAHPQLSLVFGVCFCYAKIHDKNLKLYSYSSTLLGLLCIAHSCTTGCYL